MLEEWIASVWCTPFYTDPYGGLLGKDDEVPHQRFLGIGKPDRPSPEEFFAEANLDQVRQYMALTIRGERWCDGNIAGEFELGVIQAAFQRLALLYRNAL
ncbi:MAG: hypothetical protein AMXMBFR81_14150 [Chthonomonas sp.]